MGRKLGGRIHFEQQKGIGGRSPARLRAGVSDVPSFRTALGFWFRLGLTSFGGPTGQIAQLHEELVERRRWIDEGRFLHALNFCMFLPGPEATQLAVYCGWLLHGVRGGIAAGILFVLPGALLLWALSWLYVVHGSVGWVQGLFQGLKPVVVAIVISALWSLGRRALRRWAHWVLAALAWLALVWLRLPFPWLIALAALTGWLAERWFVDETSELTRVDGAAAAVSWRRSLAVLGLGVAIWLMPVALVWVGVGGGDVLVQQGVFFSQAALVTFGGAYAVLPYVGQQAVENFGWLTTTQMMDGLGLAETTPGPLIIVVQFVGFLGAWHQPGALSPLAAATLGAAMTTWCTFVPSFVWILAGAPFVESLRGLRALRGALAAVTAAVVGVVLSLALWFARGVFWPEPAQRIDPFAVGLALVALATLRLGRVPVGWLVVGGGAVGMLARLVG
jgi:chromate transporter